MLERDRRRGSRNVLPLNGGASTFGRYSSLPVDRVGGSFMSGRPAGGGVGAASTLLEGLGMTGLGGRSPGQSQQGASSFSIGPPPVTPSPVALAPRRDTPILPTFTPQSTTSLASQLLNLFPKFQPILQDPRRRFGF